MSDNQPSSSYLSELNKTKYIDMKAEFEKRFKMNGYKPDSFFNSKIWFLKNDQQFQQLIHNQTPFSSPSNQNKIIIDLLSELNQGPDLKNLKVQTDQFISRLCEIIINSYISIQISDNTIKKNNSHQKLSKINEILNLLNMRVQGRRKGDFESTLETHVVSLKNFPSGTYKVNLKLNTSFDKEKIDELNETERNNNIPSNPDCVFNLFEEQSLLTKNLITIPNDDNSISFKQKVITHSDGNYFDEYKFKIFEKEGNAYLLDKRFSGTSFSNFRIVLNGQYDTYESKNEYFLHLLLSWFDDLCDLNKEMFSKSVVMKVHGDKDDKDYERVVTLQFDIEIDNLARIGMLNRTKELYSIPVEANMQKKLIIEEILNDYFPELKDPINSILERNEEARNACCTCMMF